MKKAIAVPLSLFLVVSVAPLASGGSGESFETEVLIRDEAPAFHGKVKSDEADCAQDRAVNLLRVKPGTNKFLGSDTTNNAGRWDILEDQFTLKSGAYYAKAFKVTLPSGDVCKGDKSDLVTVD